MSEPTETLQNPLELVGGYRAFQDEVYKAILLAFDEKQVSDVRVIDSHLAQHHPLSRVAGLQDGLAALLFGQRPLTSGNINFLQPYTHASVDSIFIETLRPYVETEGIVDPRRLLELTDAMMEESDRIIAERNAD